MILVTWLSTVGVAVFAASGALVAGRKRLDLFGVIVLAVVTAVGGGTLRDLLLGADVFWIVDPTPVYVAIGAALTTVVVARWLPRRRPVLLVADAFGMSLFAVLGAEKAVDAGTGPFVAVVLGAMSGAAGGLVRDMLSGEVPLVLRSEIYATAALLAGATFVGGKALGLSDVAALLGGVAAGFALRLAAICWSLSLPVFSLERAEG